MPFDIQHRDLKVQDVHFLEASAGTGKTFTIEHLVVRLVLESSLSIEKILVVTFTRAATRELKRRIRAALLRAQEMLKSKAAVDYLAAIQERGSEATLEAIQKIEAALICFDSAQIFTLHGFCHRMLSEFAFECKMAQEPTSPEELRPALFYKKAVKDFLLRKLSVCDYSPKQLKIALKKVRHDPFRLIDKLGYLLASETPIAAYPPLSEHFKAFTDKLASYAEMEPAKVLEDFTQLSSLYKGMKKDKDEKQITALLGLMQHCSREAFESLLLEDEWFLERMRPGNLKARYKGSQLSLHYPGFFSSLQENILPLIQEASDPTKIVLRLANDAKAHAKEYFAKYECFSPDQMLHLLDAALDSPTFLEAVRKKYAAVIIDEFQDTDPVQWKIFKRAFLGTLDTICLVGDPKQSIYAFRSADIYTYLDAASALGKENHKYLDTNFRSSLSLVHALNCLFSSPKGNGWLPLPKLQRALPVPPVLAGSKENALNECVGRGSIHFFLAEAKRGRAAQWPSNEIEEHILFPFLVSEMMKLRQKREIPWEEIAVLVKDRFQAMRLLAFFKQHAIPSSFRKGEQITASDVLYAFTDCMQAVMCPSDVSVLKIALGSKLIGWNASLLHEDLSSPLLRDAKVHMHLLQHILFERGFGPFFEAFLTKPCPGDSRGIAEKILKRGDFALYQDLRKLGEILIEEEIQRKLKGEDLLLFLQEMQNSEEEERFEIPPAEAKGSVALMTVHLSKGLEFDTVFALSLTSRHKIKENEPVKKGQWIAFDETHPDCLEAIEEIDAEKMRSLYVALTRAKQQLYIPYVIDENDQPMKSGNASPIELFFARLFKECKHSQELYEEIARLNKQTVMERLNALRASCSLTYEYLERSETPIQHSVKPAEAVISAPQRILYIPEPERLFSFSSLASKDSCHSLPDSSSADLPLGASTGIIVHRIFERLFKCSYHHPLQEKSIEELVAHEVEGSPLASYQQLLFDKVIAPLHLCLLPGDLRLKDIPSTQLFCEIEFLFPVKKNKMKGFADLFFHYQDKYYLLDWKTNYLGPSPLDYSQEKITEAMHAHQYFLQASIYTEALKRYVKLFDIRPFEEIFGGAFYVFMRGNAVFHFFPSSEEWIL